MFREIFRPSRVFFSPAGYRAADRKNRTGTELNLPAEHSFFISDAFFHIKITRSREIFPIPGQFCHMLFCPVFPEIFLLQENLRMI